MAWFPIGVERSHYYTKDTGEDLPRMSTRTTRAVKQQLERDRFQLTHSDNIDGSRWPARLLPIVPKDTPAGRRNPPAGTENSPYLSKKGEDLPSWVTSQTRVMKRHLEREQFEMRHEGNSDPLWMPARLPPLSAIDTAAGRLNPPPGTENSPYISKRGDDLLRWVTNRTRNMKQHLERGKMELTYEASGLNRHPGRVQPSPSQDAAGRRNPPKGSENSPYVSRVGDNLPTFSTATTRFMKQHLEREKFDLTYNEKDDVGGKRLQRITSSISDQPAGIVYPPIGTENSHYVSRKGRDLPTWITDSTKTMKKHLERDRFTLVYKGNEDDREPTSLRTSSLQMAVPTKANPAGILYPPTGTEILQPMSQLGDGLPTYTTKETALMKKRLGYLNFNPHIPPFYPMPPQTLEPKSKKTKPKGERAKADKA